MDPAAAPRGASAIDAGPARRGWAGWWAWAGAGALLGLVGGFLQAAGVSVGPVTVPFWAVVLVLLLMTSVRAVTVNSGARRSGLSLLVGWLVVTVLLAMPLPGGDAVIGTGGVQYFYLFGGVILGTMVAWLPAELGPVGGSRRGGHSEPGTAG